jgi:pilus assembly protein CpaB
MKWVIIGMFGLGLAAAICAAVLVVSFQGGADAPTSQLVPVLVASSDLDAFSVIESDSVTTREVPLAAAPLGSFTDPVQAVGRMLAVSVRSGAPLTADSLLADNSAAHIAASLQPGYRAVNVQLNDPMAMENLLGAGSVVDVLTSIQMEHDGRTDPVSVTLLQGVRVLAVGGRSSAQSTQAETQAEDPATMRQRPTVTLLVDANQAEKLKLAMQEGSVTLALRNPKDTAHYDSGGTALASLSPVFYTPSPAPVIANSKDSKDSKDSSPMPPPMPMPMVVPAPLQRQWDTVVLRGGVAETVSFSESAVKR